MEDGPQAGHPGSFETIIPLAIEGSIQILGISA